MSLIFWSLLIHVVNTEAGISTTDQNRWHMHKSKFLAIHLFYEHNNIHISSTGKQSEKNQTIMVQNTEKVSKMQIMENTAIRTVEQLGQRETWIK